MDYVIAKTYPFILLCAILSKELEGGARCFLPDVFQNQFRAIPRKEIRDLQKNIKFWKNRFPDFLKQFHKSIRGDKIVYNPLFYKYVAYRLLFECYRNRAKPDFDLHRCIMNYAATLEPFYLPYHEQYRSSKHYCELFDVVSFLNMWVAKCEASKDALAELSGIEEKIDSIREILVRG